MARKGPRSRDLDLALHSRHGRSGGFHIRSNVLCVGVDVGAKQTAVSTRRRSPDGDLIKRIGSYLYLQRLDYDFPQDFFYSMLCWCSEAKNSRGPQFRIYIYFLNEAVLLYNIRSLTGRVESTCDYSSAVAFLARFGSGMVSQG